MEPEWVDGIRRATAEFESEKRRIVRKTLAIVSGIYAGEHALWGPLLFLERSAATGLLAPKSLLWIMMGHMILLAAAAFGLPKPRRWGWPAAFLAAAGGAFLAVLFFLKGSAWNGALYSVYALLVPFLYVRARPPA